MKSAFVIAAPHSGSGKTTVTLSILAALKKRGLAVQSFKAGPDYIDPAHHTRITGRAARNLDTWMLSGPVNRAIFANAAQDANVCVVEGVMGLFDGVDGVREEGSTAHLAKELDLPVLLVVDARSMARSAAALVSGFAGFDPGVRLAGIIWNRVGSPTHRRILDEAAAQAGLPPVLGAYGRDPELSLGERHLGLVTPEDAAMPPEWVDKLAAAAEAALDLDALLEATLMMDPTPAGFALTPSAPICIGIPRDRAYSFYYEDNLEILRALGATLVFFKPVEGEGLPPDLDALYLGGGYPEVHAARIAANEAFLSGLRTFHASGKRIYAECGGFMTLCEGIEDQNGNFHRMAGIFPARARMGARLARLGFRRVELTPPLSASTLSARGHEFHYSSIAPMPADVPRAYRVFNARDEEQEPEGFVMGNTLGGYMHIHFGSNPEFARKVFWG